MQQRRPDLPYPMKLVPRFVPKPWGGRRIETILGRPLPVAGPVGESWEVYDRDGISSEIANGALAGAKLADLRGAEPFPLLVKILDAAKPLSIQVHPDEAAARRFGGEPKSECWFVLHADPGAQVFRGLVDGCDEAMFRDALAKGGAAACLHAVDVSAGDVLFLPAGTIHAVGAGVLLAEVQQNSDTTFRIDDWGRMGLDGAPRPLHVDEALESIVYGPRSTDRVPTQVVSDDGRTTRLLLVKSRWFSAEHITSMGTFTLDVEPGGECRYAALHILSGEGSLRPFHRKVAAVPFAHGDTLLLPEEYDQYEFTLGAAVVRAMLFRR